MSKKDLAPELHNSEQDDAQSQAQTVARQARNQEPDYEDPLASRKPEDHSPIPIEGEDLIDEMKDMKRSGRIDMDAYRGEPNHDDNVDKYGKAHRPADR